jgi:hypothetical protein
LFPISAEYSPADSEPTYIAAYVSLHTKVSLEVFTAIQSAFIAGSSPLPPIERKLINLTPQQAFVSSLKLLRTSSFISPGKTDSTALYSKTIAGYEENGSFSELPVSMSAAHSAVLSQMLILTVAV